MVGADLDDSVRGSVNLEQAIKLFTPKVVDMPVGLAVAESMLVEAVSYTEHLDLSATVLPVVDAAALSESKESVFADLTVSSEKTETLVTRA